MVRSLSWGIVGGLSRGHGNVVVSGHDREFILGGGMFFLSGRTKVFNIPPPGMYRNNPDGQICPSNPFNNTKHLGLLFKFITTLINYYFTMEITCNLIDIQGKC